ncbi:MAG: hypothetical protein ACREQ7_12555 [Candidatus Binatia bacterium]
MGKGQQISRRTWLARVALGSFAVWSEELTFGLGRRGWSVAIGGRDLWHRALGSASSVGVRHNNLYNLLGSTMRAGRV